jgi:hypothetical protein
MSAPSSPTPSPTAAVKVRLLQDALYSEDAELWVILLRSRSHVESYFREIGLQLVIHEEDGYAFLKQIRSEDGASFSPLFRRDRLTRGVAIIGVILREQMLTFEENIHDESRLVVSKTDVLALATPFFSGGNDEVAAIRKLEAAFHRAEELGLMRKISSGEEEDRFEVRRIVKARFPLDTLRELRDKLRQQVGGQDE